MNTVSAHHPLWVAFTSQILRTNKKCVRSSFKFSFLRLILTVKPVMSTLILGYSSLTSKGLNFHFIALIHPIQWTIANSGRRDRLAKRQKKTSCVSTGQPVLTLCTRQVACRTSFLSRQSDVIASFSFGACSAARNLFVNLKIGYFVGYRCF